MIIMCLGLMVWIIRRQKFVGMQGTFMLLERAGRKEQEIWLRIM